jgi:hypothetical protein
LGDNVNGALDVNDPAIAMALGTRFNGYRAD